MPRVSVPRPEHVAGVAHDGGWLPGVVLVLVCVGGGGDAGQAEAVVRGQAGQLPRPAPARGRHAAPPRHHLVQQRGRAIAGGEGGARVAVDEAEAGAVAGLPAVVGHLGLVLGGPGVGGGRGLVVAARLPAVAVVVAVVVGELRAVVVGVRGVAVVRCRGQVRVVLGVEFLLQYQILLPILLLDRGERVDVVLELRAGILLLLGVGEPALVALHEVVVGDAAAVGEHQLPHRLLAELGRLLHAAAAARRGSERSL